MVLNGINKNKEIVCPSRLIEEGKDAGDVFRLVRQNQSIEPYYCPECLGKYSEWVEVRFVRSMHVRCHFGHLGNKGQKRLCEKKVSESEKHLTAKHVIAKRLELDYFDKLSEPPHIDDRFFYGDGVATKRKPDIWVQFVGGAYEIHEVQLSRIDSAQLDERTRDLRKFLRNEMMDASIKRNSSPNGFKELAAGKAASVHWYMSPQNLNSEIRSWAAQQTGVYLYRLVFDKETHHPTWTADKKLEAKKEKTKLQESEVKTDNCRYTPNKKPETNQPRHLSQSKTYWRRNTRRRNSEAIHQTA